MRRPAGYCARGNGFPRSPADIRPPLRLRAHLGRHAGEHADSLDRRVATQARGSEDLCQIKAISQPRLIHQQLPVRARAARGRAVGSFGARRGLHAAAAAKPCRYPTPPAPACLPRCSEPVDAQRERLPQGRVVIRRSGRRKRGELANRKFARSAPPRRRGTLRSGTARLGPGRQAYRRRPCAPPQ